jgi:hypothetical protein
MPANPSPIFNFFVFQFNSRDTQEKGTKSDKAEGNETLKVGMLPVEQEKTQPTTE